MLTPVFAVYAVLMSLSAFFIDAAANTVRALSCASADEWIDPSRIVRATKNPAKRRMMPLRAWSRARSAHATQALVVDECDRRKRRSGCPRPAYGRTGISPWSAYSIIEVGQRPRTS